jgi:hypothetical protein
MAPVWGRGDHPLLECRHRLVGEDWKAALYPLWENLAPGVKLSQIEALAEGFRLAAALT